MKVGKKDTETSVLSKLLRFLKDKLIKIIESQKETQIYSLPGLALL